MTTFKKWAFAIIMLGALMTSAHATYMVLTESLNTGTIIALLAAIVIDLAAIWMGAHAAELAEDGDSTLVVNSYTVFLMLLSLSINFYYGYNLSNSWVTGLLACIFPVIAMVTYERWIQHKIHAAKKRNGFVLPKMPKYVTNKYQDTEAVTQFKKDYAQATLEDAQSIMRYRFEQRRRELVSSPVTQDTPPVTAEVQRNSTELHNELQVTAIRNDLDTPLHNELQELDGVFDRVTKEHAEVTGLPDWLHLDMTEVSEVTRACVEHGVTDLDTVQGYINTIKEGVSYNAIKQSLFRAKKKALADR